MVLDDPKVTSLTPVAGIVGVGGVACISGWLFTSLYYINNLRSTKYISRVLRCAGIHLGSGYGIIQILMAVMPPPYSQKDRRDVPAPSAHWLHSRADRSCCACRLSQRPSLSHPAGSPGHDFPGRGLSRAVSGMGLPRAAPVAAGPRHDYAVPRTAVRPPSGRGGARAHRLEVSVRAGPDGPRLRLFRALRIPRPLAGWERCSTPVRQAARTVSHHGVAHSTRPATHRLDPCARGHSCDEPPRTGRRDPPGCAQ